MKISLAYFNMHVRVIQQVKVK